MRDLPQQGVSTDGYYSCPAGPPEGTLGPQPTDNTSRARKDSLLCAGTFTKSYTNMPVFVALSRDIQQYLGNIWHNLLVFLLNCKQNGPPAGIIGYI